MLYLNLEAHIFHYPGGGRKTKGPGGCVQREIWKPLACGSQSSPKLTPTLSASSHMPKKGLLTRTARLPRLHTCEK